ncbi:hypothetical protein J4438_03725 [Candidatus Woesearchaeota archaeon]|nr:hypothetical protein [Candidatus Woesearchaeota archaeon]
MDPLSYYSRSEIKKEIVFNAQDREVAVRYGDGGFGKRPDMIQFDNDVLDLVKKGASSFHISEEHWKDALRLKPGMTKRELDDLRSGWDLVLDIDCEDLEDSKIIAFYLIEAMKFHDVNYISVKYSGNKGFHIAVPFKSFPNVVNGVEVKKLFPEGPKVISEYLVDMIKKPIMDKYGKEFENKLKVDSVLISSRHMFRAAYSLHEKSGLVSLPILAEELMSFNKESAKPENAKAVIKFLDSSNAKEGEATSLITQAFDWMSKQVKREENNEVKKTSEFDEITEKIPEDYFPACIKKGLVGLEDGRKRFLFILLNFLRCVGWSNDEIEKRVLEWNKNLSAPLKEGYVISQLKWHKSQKGKMLPPNYDNRPYYADIGILSDEEANSNIKNPVTYTVRRLRMMQRQNKKKKKQTKPL